MLLIVQLAYTTNKLNLTYIDFNLCVIFSRIYSHFSY